jgi:toxin-antitoxin system PIN domain toxin
LIIPDVNVLLNAYDRDSKFHKAVAGWWEEALGGPAAIGLPWVSILGFIRLITNPRIYASPTTPSQAIRVAKSWLAQPNVEIVSPGNRHADILFGLLESAGVAGNLTTDAHLAALAIEHGAQLASTDNDFARFPKLRWFNPAVRR